MLSAGRTAARTTAAPSETVAIRIASSHRQPVHGYLVAALPGGRLDVAYPPLGVASRAQPDRELTSEVGVRCAFFEAASKCRDRRMLITAVVRQDPCDLERGGRAARLVFGSMAAQRVRIRAPVVRCFAQVFERPRRLAPARLLRKP